MAYKISEQVLALVSTETTHEVYNVSCVGAMIREDQTNRQAEVYDLRTRVEQPARRDEQSNSR